MASIVGDSGPNGLIGTSEPDTISGLGGDDALVGLDGKDTLNGGAGVGDYVSYEPDPAGVTINLAQGFAIDGWGKRDRILNVESAHGSRFADSIDLTDFGNYAFGLGGNDTIHGLAGDDLLIGGSGGDLLDGGDDFDLADFVDDAHVANGPFQHGATVNLSTGMAHDGWGYTDTLVSIEGLSGSRLKDRFTGDAGRNTLLGQLGNDDLKGGGGEDRLDGGEGNDLINGGGPDKTLERMDGSDEIEGGLGEDMFVCVRGFLNDRTGMRGQYGDVYVENHVNADGKLQDVPTEIDHVTNCEIFKFRDHTFKLDPFWTQLVPIDKYTPGFHLNDQQNPDGTYTTLITPKVAFLRSLLGDPKSDEFKSHLKTELIYQTHDADYGVDIRDTGFALAIDSLQEILFQAESDHPGLLDQISSRGMWVIRNIAGTSKYSSHSWGLAIDLRVDGLLDHDPGGMTHEGIAQLIPYFNDAGWIAGAGFGPREDGTPAEDDMHFQVSKQLLQQWEADGLLA